MRFFNFTSSESIENIITKFNCLRAVERHTIYNIFEYYYDNRIGIHTYINGNTIKGYYETGELNRHDALQHSKVWFYGKLVENRGVCQFRGIIISISLIIEIILLMQSLCAKDPFALAICGVLIFFELRDERTMYECLYNMML